MGTVTISNIVAGKEKDSAEHISISEKLTGKSLFQIPNASLSDLNLAIKSAHSMKNGVSNVPIDDIIEITKKVGKSFLTDPQKIDLIIKTTGSPRKYVLKSVQHVREFLLNFESFLDAIFEKHRILDTGKEIIFEGKLIGKRMYHPKEGVLSLILAGNEVALAPFAISQVVAARVPVIIKASTAEPVSTFEIVRSYYDAGLSSGLNLLYWSSKEKPNLITHLLNSTKMHVIFGSDENILQLIPRSNGKTVYPFWTGRSTAIVFEDADVQSAASHILEGATADRGNKCISTKKIYVHKNIATKLINTLKSEAKRLTVGNPDSEEVNIAHTTKEEIEHIKHKLLEESEILHNGISDCAIGPILIKTHNRSMFVKEEFPAPVLALVEFSSLEEAITLANEAVSHSPSGKSLATAIFTSDDATKHFAVKYLKTYKVIMNKSTTNMHFALPHQGIYLIEELYSTDKIIDLGV